ncbi:MAG: c-type cytochrome, partial [Gammaproteobacteria bacterium]
MPRYHETPLPLAAGLCLAMAVSLVQAQGHADLASRTRATCTACHGATGNASQAAVPSLAGQHARYLVKQLRDFRSGARNNAVMSPAAAPLSSTTIERLAAYYARQTAEPGTADPALVALGMAVYRGGGRSRAVAACMACHGPAASGNPAAGVPSLRGQRAEYTASQLRAYAAGERDNDTKAVMRAVAAALTGKEI